MKFKVNMGELPDVIGVPPGKHKARITEINEDVSGQGNQMLVWTWTVKGVGQINSYTILDKEKGSGLKQHLLALGAKNDQIVTVDTQKLVGQYACISVVMRKYRDRTTGEEKEGSSVDRVLPLSALEEDDEAEEVKPKKAKKVVEEDEEDEAEDLGSKPKKAKKASSEDDDEDDDTLPF